MTRFRTPVATVLILLLAACAANPGNRGYQYYVTGNPADVETGTKGLVVMQGGGDDVDANYIRMGEYAGGGDFVVLRASGVDEYNDYIHALCTCDSVETLVFSNREAAFDPFVIQTLRRAEAVFIAGGDQSNYVRFWKGTPVEDAIHFVAAKPAPVGGTSAGMAILGEFTYSAMTAASLSSDVALSNPYHPDLTLEGDFLRLDGMENLLTDQHLIERDRIGRTITMLARLVQDGWTPQGHAIASDRETALHLEPSSGAATVFATGSHATPYVYFLRTSRDAAVCRPDTPLTMHEVDVYRLPPGGTFNVRTWTGSGGLAYSLRVDAGNLASTRGSIY